jgi:hypothetical protein
MAYKRDLTRHSPEQRKEWSRAAIREMRAGNNLVAYCLQQAADGYYYEKDLTWFQRLLRWWHDKHLA